VRKMKMTPKQVRERLAQLSVLVKDAEHARDEETCQIQLRCCEHDFQVDFEDRYNFYVCVVCGACADRPPRLKKTKKEKA